MLAYKANRHRSNQARLAALAKRGYIIRDSNLCVNEETRQLCCHLHILTECAQFDCSGTKIESLQGCPTEVDGHFLCFKTPIVSLKDAHKHIKRIGGFLGIPGEVNSHILGVLKIRDLHFLTVQFYTEIDNGRTRRAIKIVNKYLKDEPNPSKRDIHTCQEEMIEEGLAEYAQL